jgi:hypothetical protein
LAGLAPGCWKLTSKPLEFPKWYCLLLFMVPLRPHLVVYSNVVTQNVDDGLTGNTNHMVKGLRHWASWYQSNLWGVRGPDKSYGQLFDSFNHAYIMKLNKNSEHWSGVRIPGWQYSLAISDDRRVRQPWKWQKHHIWNLLDLSLCSSSFLANSSLSPFLMINL